MILVKVEESEDDEAESAKGSGRKGRSGKPGRDSAEMKEPVTPRTQVKLALMSQIARLLNKLTTPLCPFHSLASAMKFSSISTTR
ncbi:hypothetical protein V6N12_074999 [Hibiscus sabdariffa]|uniref:Uncharacterized protein n=1 Tax=Hibiscus sabdariffa TaxID=183260 RepID=A0ABR2BZA2_9ROSI